MRMLLCLGVMASVAGCARKLDLKYRSDAPSAWIVDRVVGLRVVDERSSDEHTQLDKNDKESLFPQATDRALYLVEQATDDALGRAGIGTGSGGNATLTA